jgi:hypothetical protein
VNKVLKNAGFAPGWITERKEIEQEVEGARKSLALAVFRKVVQALNQRIRDVNLIQPGQVPSLPVLDAEREIRKVLEGM